MKKRSKLLISFCALVVAMISMSLVAFAAEPSQKPGKVTGVKETGAGTSYIDISWDAQLINGCKYKVEVSLDGVNWIEKKDSSSNSAYIYDGINAGTTYKVRVRAYTSWYNTDTYEREYVYADQYSDIISVTTYPEEPAVVTGLKQTSATKNSITLKWNKSADVTGYYVYNGNGKDAKLLANVKTNSVTLKNINAKNKYNIYVYPYKTVVNKTAVNDGYSSSNSLYDSYIKLIPAKVSSKSIDVDYYWATLKKLNISWAKVARADGYQIYVYQYNGKKTTYRVSSTYTSTDISKILKNRFYKIKIRAYTTINGTKKYGEWSSYSYQAQQPDVISTRQVGSKKQVKVRWDSVKGATSYTVYMSTKQTSGYKKVGTTKRTYLNVSKIGKTKLRKNKSYYVYVVANRKVGKTTYKSGADYCWKFKLTK